MDIPRVVDTVQIRSLGKDDESLLSPIYFVDKTDKSVRGESEIKFASLRKTDIVQCRSVERFVLLIPNPAPRDAAGNIYSRHEKPRAQSLRLRGVPFK